MACGCGGRRKQVHAGGETLGYMVIYPDGSATSEDAPFMSILEAKATVREAGGGTIKRLVRRPGNVL